MTELKQVYKCSICGNIVEVMHPSYGTLVCCGKPMELLKENNTDATIEKHVPVLEKTKTGILVKIGSVAHPMEKEHYIEWIELITDGISHIKHLTPKDKPEALFCVCNAKKISAREYCNIHGLWASK